VILRFTLLPATELLRLTLSGLVLLKAIVLTFWLSLVVERAVAAKARVAGVVVTEHRFQHLVAGHRPSQK
jgi:hypothetical protein